MPPAQETPGRVPALKNASNPTIKSIMSQRDLLLIASSKRGFPNHFVQAGRAFVTSTQRDFPPWCSFWRAKIHEGKPCPSPLSCKCTDLGHLPLLSWLCRVLISPDAFISPEIKFNFSPKALMGPSDDEDLACHCCDEGFFYGCCSFCSPLGSFNFFNVFFQLEQGSYFTVPVAVLTPELVLPASCSLKHF